VKYANERVQFNTPIAEFGAIRSKLAEMAMNYADESLHRAAKDMKRITAREAEDVHTRN
jgi:alkylation response protein AidB-like acyl-CoA dehydrogenase